MRESKHTPTPYTCQGEMDNEQIMDTQWVVLAGNAIVVKTIFDNGKANAKFIVQACNSHDKLVAALKQIVHTFESPHKYNANGDAVNMFYIAETALAAAKETPCQS